jgi:hypothetical protein
MLKIINRNFFKSGHFLIKRTNKNGKDFRLSLKFPLKESFSILLQLVRQFASRNFLSRDT